MPAAPLQQTPSEEGQGVGTLPDAHFRPRLWGYDRAAVDAYVERSGTLIADALTHHTPEGAVTAALDRLGEETSAVLQRAHQIADEVAARSQKEAEQCRQQAEHDAASMRQAAEQRVATLDAEIDKLWDERQRLLADMDRISVELHALVTTAHDRVPEAADPQDGAEPLDTPPSQEPETLEHDTSSTGARSATG